MGAAAERANAATDESEEVRRARRREIADRDKRAKKCFPDPAAFDEKSDRMVEARRRERIVGYGNTLSGGQPWRLKRIEAAIEQKRGALHGYGPVPSLSSYQRWTRRYRAAGNTIAGLIDLPPVGCKPRDIRGKVATRLKTLVFGRAAKFRVGSGRRPSWTRISRLLSAWCNANGAPAPSVHAVRRYVLSIPATQLFMAEFGTKATRARRSPKSTNPTNRALELFFADETMLPTWVKVWHQTEKKWYAARTWAVFVLDAHTRAIVAWWVKEPSAVSASRRLHSHFTALEVVATVAGAVDPNWADPDLRNFARGEPGEIRLDGSGNTKSAAKLLKDKGFNTSVGQPYASWCRGVMEHYFATLKERDLNALTGDDDVHLPYDPDREDPRTTRERNSGDEHKMEPYRFEIPVESLGETHQVVSVIRHAVNAYNETPHRGLDFVTPASLFEKTAPRMSQTSSPVLGLFKGHKLTVDPRGVEVANVWYQSLVLQEVFPPGTEVFVRSDPFERGVLVYPERPSARGRVPALFVGQRDRFARALTAEAFNRVIKADLADIRDEINEARDEMRDEDLGTATADAFRGDIAERSRAQDAKSRRGKSSAAPRGASGSTKTGDTKTRGAKTGGASMKSSIPSTTELRAQADAPKEHSVAKRCRKLDENIRAANGTTDEAVTASVELVAAGKAAPRKRKPVKVATSSSRTSALSTPASQVNAGECGLSPPRLATHPMSPRSDPFDLDELRSGGRRETG